MTDRTFDVAVIGELNADLILRGDVTPVFGQVEKLIDDADLVLGSSSAIFACGCARLGLNVTFIGKVGDDVLGAFVVSQLKARGVDTSGVVVDPTIKTGLSVIFSQGNDRAILTYLGSISKLTEDDISRGKLRQVRHLHVGSFFLLDGMKGPMYSLLRDLRWHGVTASLDTNYDPSGEWDVESVLPHLDVFLPNETELTKIARTDDVEEALRRLSEKGPLIAAKFGERGAIARRGDERVEVPALPMDVVDTTGAGDSFDAGFVYGLLAGWDLERTLRLAAACGSLSTRAAGGTAGQATLAEALAAAGLE